MVVMSIDVCLKQSLRLYTFVKCCSTNIFGAILNRTCQELSFRERARSTANRTPWHPNVHPLPLDYSILPSSFPAICDDFYLSMVRNVDTSAYHGLLTPICLPFMYTRKISIEDFIIVLCKILRGDSPTEFRSGGIRPLSYVV